MKLVVARETFEGEKRVALAPSSVDFFLKRGFDVVVECSAGAGSFFQDEEYAQKGAIVTSSLAEHLAQCDLLLSVRRPSADLMASLKRGVYVVGLMDPYDDLSPLHPLADLGATVFSLERIPRLSRAQTMDALSSQANLAGYKAVVDAASLLEKAFPMMMTAAGTVPAAKVFVMGAGVAGLQAIATARRLGAVVSATDVRQAAGEQIKSLGAKFIFLEGLEDASTAKGYAASLSEEDQKRQQALIAEHIQTQDVVITTALIPGRPAPLLLTQDMVEAMRPGSVIVDLAVERGGNCALSRKGICVEHKGVRIVGADALPSRIAGNASALYSKNIQSFAALFLDNAGAFSPDWTDDILAQSVLLKAGEWVDHDIRRKS